MTSTCAWIRGDGTCAASPSSTFPVAVPLPRIASAKVSARSWGMLRGSSGPCMLRARAVSRFQPAKAWWAGRCAESQAMPSWSGRNSTRRSATDLAWRFSMLSAWWRSRQILALALNRCAGICPAGQPRAGSGAPGSRKCPSSAAAPAASRLAVSSTMARACCHDRSPASSADSVRGSVVARAWEAARNDDAARGPRDSTHPTSAATAISCACTEGSGPATRWALSEYVTAAFAFNAANPAST